MSDYLNYFREMSRLQGLHNQRIHPEWRTAGFSYSRAVWVECAELMNHFGWKWWHKQKTDPKQVLLELVDIWHFGLSMLIIENMINARVAQKIETHFETGAKTGDLHDCIENFVRTTLAGPSFPLFKFIDICIGMDISFEDLYQHYIGKHVLNQFRQDHGYMDNGYMKVWDGREDNEHLIEIIDRIPGIDAGFQRRLYNALGDRYEKALAIQR